MTTTNIKLVPRATSDDIKRVIDRNFLAALSANIYTNSAKLVDLSLDICEEILLVLAKEGYILLTERNNG